MNNTQKKNVDLDGPIFTYKGKLERIFLISLIINLFRSLMSQIIKRINLIFQLIKIKRFKEILRIIYLNNNWKVKRSFWKGKQRKV